VPTKDYSYTGLTGPLNWYGLNKTANEKCSTGMYQSPIEIDGSSNVTWPHGSSINLSIPLHPGAEFENLKTTVEVKITAGTLEVDTKTYRLQQFHFHTPSEHRIYEQYFAMELHFVFQAAAGILFLS
jgi:carbonic anhydrase